MRYDENGTEGREFTWDENGNTYLTQARARFGRLKSVEGWRYNPRMVR